MRIYGGHDYYDCAMALGRDPSITLFRGKSKDVPAEVCGSLLKQRIEVREKARWGGEVGESIAVVFCGKIYRGFLFPREFVAGRGEEWDGLWASDKFKSWVSQRELQKKPVNVGMTGSSHRTRKGTRADMSLEQFFAPAPVSEELHRWMILNRVSIMIERLPRRGEEPYFEINPTGLKQIGFAKALDPYTAFQELSMWIGGVLGGTSPEIVTIKDDKTLIEGHGFDNKFSFRGPRLA